MSQFSLRHQVIRLAATRQDLRPYLVQALRAASASYQDYVSRKKDEGDKPLSKPDWEAKVQGKGDGKGKGDKDTTKKWDRVKTEHKDKAKGLLRDILMKPGTTRNLLRYHMSDLAEVPELKVFTDLQYADDWEAAEKRIKARKFDGPEKTEKRLEALAQVKKKSDEKFDAYVDKLVSHVQAVVEKQETGPADYPDDNEEQDFLVDLVSKGAPRGSEVSLAPADIKRVVRTLLFGKDK